MKPSVKNTIGLISLVVIYILMAVLGVYELAGFILLPILSIPFTIYIIKNKQPIGIHLLYHVAVIGGIYLVTGYLMASLLYIACIAVPAYVLKYLYKEKLPLPNMIIYTTMLVTVVIYLYVLLMKRVGIDYEAIFIQEVDLLVNTLVINLGQSVELAGLTGQVDLAQLEKGLIDVMSVMKMIYASWILIGIFTITTLSVLIINLVLRLRNHEIPSAKELLQFRVSKIVLVILMIAMIVIANGSSNSVMVLAVNIIFIINMLLSLMGGLALMGLLQRTSSHGFFKVLGYILIIILYGTMPTVLIIFGFLDTLFNYRKVSIIV